jgi:hypothetical protein
VEAGKTKMRSPFYMNRVLKRWSTKNKIDIGKRGYRGWSFFIENGELEMFMFVIEYRGPGFPPIRIEQSYHDRFTTKFGTFCGKTSVLGREHSWQHMKELYKRMSNQQ